jgi:hypothetical protein
MHGQDADIIIAQAGEGISVLNKGTSEKNATRWIKSRQGTQQGDPIGMTMYACGQRKVLQQTIDFMNQLAKKWIREHGKDTPKGRAARDWLVIANADDLAFVGPSEIAALIFCRYAYLNKLYNNSDFKPSKNQAFSMGLTTDDLTAKLREAFDDIRLLPQKATHDFTTQEERTHRATKAYPTLSLGESGNCRSYSLLVAPEKELKFSSQTNGIDGVELLGIPIEREQDNRLTQIVMLRQLAKTMKTWEKAKKQIKSNHARFQILNLCLRTKFHHFCRGIRPSKMNGPDRGIPLETRTEGICSHSNLYPGAKRRRIY